MTNPNSTSKVTMEQPKEIRYSLVVPHYDDFARLERLLSSLPQGRRDLEILVIDDCSPDQEGLAAISSKWSTVKFLSTPENKGAGVARNIGLDYATGKYLLFADSDDTFLQNAFEQFDEHLKGEPDLVYFLCQSIQESNGAISIRANGYNQLCYDYVSSPSNVNLQRLKLGHVGPCAKVYSRSFLARVGVRHDETRVGNDVAFNVLSALNATKIKVLLIPVYCIYRRQGSLTTKLNPDVFLERLGVVTQLARKLKSLGVRELPSGTGWLLTSIRYGPKVMFKTWRICLMSDMRINLLKVLQLNRWWRFMVCALRSAREINSTSSTGRKKT